ncbi:MAG TPA: dienelactone hydrolase family protein [Candidatus Tumulicola sp.]|jgi:carboxymethylenebutenolidase
MPTDFRDGRTYPRRGRQTIGEALWLLRMADKGRAAAAGTIHDYIYPCPMDKGVMERWGVTRTEFEAALAAHSDDASLADWLTQHVTAGAIRSANEWLRGERAANLDRQDAEEGVTEFVRPDGQRAPGFYAEPERPDGAPGVVLFEEWWGLTDHVRETAERLAGDGFRVLVPDLYRGRVAATGDEANHLMEGLDFSDAVTQDARGAAAYLKAQGSHKVGVLGFCMGGALAMLAAIHDPDFDAAVVFYGFPPAEAGDPASIRIPVMCHWAVGDEFFNIERVDAIERALEAAGVAHEFHRYDAKHAFYNPGGLGNYHAEHAETAWARTLEFLRRTLA